MTKIDENTGLPELPKNYRWFISRRFEETYTLVLQKGDRFLWPFPKTWYRDKMAVVRRYRTTPGGWSQEEARAEAKRLTAEPGNVGDWYAIMDYEASESDRYMVANSTISKDALTEVAEALLERKSIEDKIQASKVDWTGAYPPKRVK